MHTLLQAKEGEVREIAKNLFWYDYLSAEEMEEIFAKKRLKKEKIREWKGEKYVISF